MLETVLATRSLRAVAFTPDDLPALIALHGDPEVNRHLDGEAAAWDPVRLAGRLVDYVTGVALQGFGMWKILTRDGDLVGRAGFEPFDDTSEIAMEIVLARGHWGRGFGRELAPALVRWFFDNTSYTHLISFARPEHLTAQRVLQAAGMDFRERRSVRGRPQDVFQALSPALDRLVANGSPHYPCRLRLSSGASALSVRP
ncbi:GNAT family N-acetyltransferase [Microvirga tunisiensis]|uniref:GNAT family N-acetyltransferase n=2 Tax=Pannonibacter tanglangensis TaxID=2750084 RepID=A0ABW9ZG43_9HYPH|nr:MULTISPECIES: GNAT family N-acetyltransferase [unclassified Pannonibacter]NBN63406.1 GNAT family N-acetyltransferase [Pannonibacter sp. XCT-34]NBN77041.1 GNAT family N-acetyltransferase [Pannonibacter sp. XCT-53]